MPKNLLNDEELKQLVSGSEYLSGAFPGHAVPAMSPSRVAARGTARRISNAARPGFERARLSRRSRRSLGLFQTSRSRAERAGPARRVPEHPICTECARTRAYNAPRASLGAPLVPHRTHS